jgi:hypothetical protein
MEKFVNLAAQGIKRKVGPPNADIETIKLYHPEVLYALGIVCVRMELSGAWVLIDGAIPDLIVSGYRDAAQDPEVKNSPHEFAGALDIEVSKLDAGVTQYRPGILDMQIAWAEQATVNGLFTRAGLYPEQNTIHLDIMDAAWMKEFNGTPFWVKWHGKYQGFQTLDSAATYAKAMIYSEQHQHQGGA